PSSSSFAMTSSTSSIESSPRGPLAEKVRPSRDTETSFGTWTGFLPVLDMVLFLLLLSPPLSGYPEPAANQPISTDSCIRTRRRYKEPRRRHSAHAHHCPTSHLETSTGWKCQG